MEDHIFEIYLVLFGLCIYFVGNVFGIYEAWSREYFLNLCLSILHCWSVFLFECDVNVSVLFCHFMFYAVDSHYLFQLNLHLFVPINY